jgi:hypothetical protein
MEKDEGLQTRKDQEEGKKEGRAGFVHAARTKKCCQVRKKKERGDSIRGLITRTKRVRVGKKRKGESER